MSTLRRLWAKVFSRRDRDRAPVATVSDLEALAARPALRDEAGWRDEVQVLANLGQWEGAIACLDKAIDLDPQCVTAWSDKARYLAALGRLEEAVDCYVQVLTLDPQMATAWFGKALAEEKLGRTRDAIQSYKLFIAVGTDQDAEQIKYARHCIRDLQSETTQPQEPTGSVRSAPRPRHPPRDSSTRAGGVRKGDRVASGPSTRRDRARAGGQPPGSGREGRPVPRPSQRSRAIPYLIPIPIGLIFWLILTLVRGCDAPEVSYHPSPPQSGSTFRSQSDFSAFGLGSRAYFRGEYDTAIRYFTMALDSHVPVGDVYNRRALAYHEKGEYEKALQDFEQALSLNSEPAMAHNNRAVTYFAMGEDDKAMADLSKAIELQSTFGKAYYNRGLVHSSLRDYEAAIEDLSQALLYPASESSSLLLHRALAQNPTNLLGDWLGADELEREFLETGVDPPSVLYQRAIAYQAQGKVDSALADLDRAIELLTERLAETAAFTSRLESTPPSETTAVPEEKVGPANPRVNLPSVYYLRALVYVENGDYDQAAADLDRAMELGLDPDVGQRLRALLDAWGAWSLEPGD